MHFEKIAALILLAFIANASAGTGPCPFSQLCTCEQNDARADPTVFTRAYCFGGSFPVFTSPSGVKYTIEQDLTVGYTDVSRIPDRAFAVFKKIGQLAFSQNNFNTAQKWDDHAFDGLDSVTQLVTEYLLGMVPPPKAVISLDANAGLQQYTITNSAIKTLSDNAFQGMKNIKRLIVQVSEVATISDHAFDGLALEYLGLSYNQIISVPKNVLPNLPKLQQLDLSNNVIQTLETDAFHGGNNLLSVTLDGNLIRTLQPGPFNSLTSVKVLSVQNFFNPSFINSIDLSVFGGINDDVTILLSNSYYLETLTVSDIDKVPKNAYFNVSSTGVETVDSKLDQLLDHLPALKIDISRSFNLDCQGADWMAKYALCGQQPRLIIDGATCADKQDELLATYLKSIVQDPCK